MLKMPAWKAWNIYIHSLHVWKGVPFATDISLSCLVPSPNLWKCTMQMEADLTPFCSGWNAHECLPHYRSLSDRHSRCVKPKKLCGYTLRWTLVMEKECEGFFSFVYGILLLFCFSFRLFAFYPHTCATLQPNTQVEVLLVQWKMCLQSSSNWQGDERLI